MRTSSQRVVLPDQLNELPRVHPRSLADLVLFGITATALAVLFLTSFPVRIVDWFYVLQHLLVLGFALTRPAPLVADCSPESNIAVAVAYLYPYAQVICLRCWPGRVPWAGGGIVLTTVAAVASVVCLLTIGKEFGVRPALRGLVTNGPYRLVRHPLYLSYLMADIGYNLQLCNVATVPLALLGWACMAYRIVAEERVVSRDPRWPAYVVAVPYRILPGLW